MRRFAGVWYAGTSGKAELAEYELEEVVEDIERLLPIGNGVDVCNVLEGVVNSRIHDLRLAIRSNDPQAFEEAYAATMAACNSCYRFADCAFIVITMSGAPPVHNRAFHPVDTSVPVAVQTVAD